MTEQADLVQDVAAVVTEGRENMAEHTLGLKGFGMSLWFRANFHDQAKKWPSPGNGSKYLGMLIEFVIVFPSRHKYLVQSPSTSQNTLTPWLCLGGPYLNAIQSRP